MKLLSYLRLSLSHARTDRHDDLAKQLSREFGVHGKTGTLRGTLRVGFEFRFPQAAREPNAHTADFRLPQGFLALPQNRQKSLHVIGTHYTQPDSGIRGDDRKSAFSPGAKAFFCAVYFATYRNLPSGKFPDGANHG
jgi:hypothetical protein